MDPKISPSLSVAAHLKRTFKHRCGQHNLSMAAVLVGLIDGWLLGRYQITTKSASEGPQTIYVPAEAHRALRAHCQTSDHPLAMRAALEELMAGWLAGRFRWPPKEE